MRDAMECCLSAMLYHILLSATCGLILILWHFAAQLWCGDNCTNAVTLAHITRSRSLIVGPRFALLEMGSQSPFGVAFGMNLFTVIMLVHGS